MSLQPCDVGTLTTVLQSNSESLPHTLQAAQLFCSSTGIWARVCVTPAPGFQWVQDWEEILPTVGWDPEWFHPSEEKREQNEGTQGAKPPLGWSG